MQEYPLDYKPILRYVDAIPSQHSGQPVFLLRDPLGFVEEIIAVPQSMGIILALMDGEHDLRDIQAEVTKHFGEIVPIEEIVKIVKFLDEKGLLWSENFEKLKEKAYEKWFSYQFKPMAHAGQAYPVEKEPAVDFVKEILSLVSVENTKTPRVLIVPHIDIRAGAEAYAHGYNRFSPVEGARIIVFGVGHHLDLPYSILTKDIATPFGIVKSDRGGIFYLTHSKKIEIYPDHIAHKLEHSIEFQTLFLNYLLKDGFVVLPVLLGPLPAVLHEEEVFKKFAEAIAELIDETTYFVLGIDFCHLGLRYGDPYEVTSGHISKALELDKTLLEMVCNSDSKEFLEKAKEVEFMKVCGITCLYLLKLVFEAAGINPELEIYHQEAVPFGKGSIVSVCSAGMHF